MQGLIILALSFLASFLVSKFTNLKPLVNYNDKFEYSGCVGSISI